VLSLLIAISFVGALYGQEPATIFKSEVPYHLRSMKYRQADKQQEKGERVWEQAIAAKGGRDRLYAVCNMVISTRKVTIGLFPKTQVRREELLVFPNLYWFRDDYRPDVFGVSVHMYNYNNNTSSVFSDDKTNHTPKPTTDVQGRKALKNDQLSFLLESKWLKPTILKANTGRIGPRSVDIVQTMVEGERVDFAFDRETHLPVRVSYYDVVNGKTYVNVQSFSDYMDVAGIKVPQTVEYDDGSKYKAAFQFNVEYDENIFINPPPIEAGPEAWKVAKQ
jgi:hypothetical protein